MLVLCVVQHRCVSWYYEIMSELCSTKAIVLMPLDGQPKRIPFSGIQHYYKLVNFVGFFPGKFGPFSTIPYI